MPHLLMVHKCTQAYTISHILNIPLARKLHNLNLHLISQGLFNQSSYFCRHYWYSSFTFLDSTNSHSHYITSKDTIDYKRNSFCCITTTAVLLLLWLNYICLPSWVAWNMCPWNSEESYWLNAHWLRECTILRFLNYYVIIIL